MSGLPFSRLEILDECPTHKVEACLSFVVASFL
jgi:hypothetical protein